MEKEPNIKGYTYSEILMMQRSTSKRREHNIEELEKTEILVERLRESIDWDDNFLEILEKNLLKMEERKKK